MIVLLLAGRLIGLEERRHGTWFATDWHIAPCRKPPCPSLPSEAERKIGEVMGLSSSGEVALLSARPLGVEKI
jgi:hypothetical protein